jgi:hypothetical protein
MNFMVEPAFQSGCRLPIARRGQAPPLVNQVCSKELKLIGNRPGDKQLMTEILLEDK